MIAATLVTFAHTADSTAHQLRITVTNWIPPAPIHCARLIAGNDAPTLAPIKFLEDQDQ